MSTDNGVSSSNPSTSSRPGSLVGGTVQGPRSGSQDSQANAHTPKVSRTSEFSSAVSSDRPVLDMMMRVTTPENISFQYRLVGPFRRIFAYVLDMLILGLAYGALVFLIYLLFAFVLFPLAARIGVVGFLEVFAGMLIGVMQVGYFIIYWFYGAIMETYYNGQTLGKRMLRMRVISKNGHSIDGVQATLRNFFRLLDTMPFVPFATLIGATEPIPGAFPTCLFGLIIMTLSPKYQRVGDLVAGTVVVNEERSRLPNLATFSDERVPLLAELIPAGFVVPPSMARAIADYADQRRFLPYQRASEVASHLAAPLIEKFGLASDTDHDLFLCSLYYKTFVATTGTEEDDAPMKSSAMLQAQGHALPETNQIKSPYAGSSATTVFDDDDFQFPDLEDTKS